MASEPQLLAALTLGCNADSTEFCPVPALSHLLAVGTYELIEERQERVGQCLLYAFDPEAAKDGPVLQLLASRDVPGVFDLKWGALGGQLDAPILGAALADGTIRALKPVRANGRASFGVSRSPGGGLLMSWLCVHGARAQADGTSGPPGLDEVASCQACSSGMCLSLDWQCSGGARIAASSSAGSLSVVQVRATTTKPTRGPYCARVVVGWMTDLLRTGRVNCRLPHSISPHGTPMQLAPPSTCVHQQWHRSVARRPPFFPAQSAWLRPLPGA